MIYMTLIGPQMKVKVIHLVPIKFSYTTSYRLFSNFCSRTHRLATILHVTDDDRQTQHCTNSATVSTVG